MVVTAEYYLFIQNFVDLFQSTLSGQYTIGNIVAISTEEEQITRTSALALTMSTSAAYWM